MSTQTAPGSQPTSADEDLTIPRDFGELWEKALRNYKKETGKDLLTLPFAKDFPSRPDSAKEVIKHFREKDESFKTFRDVGENVLGVLETIVHFVHLFIDSTAEAAAPHLPGGKAILVAVGVLLQATKGVSRLYDAVESLLQRIKGYFERVSIHLEPSMPPSPELMNTLVDTLVHIFAALGLATKYCDSAVNSDSRLKKGARALFRRTKDYFRVLVDKTGIQAILDELDVLTDRERLVTAASTYAVARDTHGVVEEVKPQVKFLYDEAVVNSFRSWLHPPNEQALNDDKKRQPDSCQWFFDAEFEEWKAQKNGVYWVYGNAGAGKSVLCSSVIDKLKGDSSLSLAYFYFDYSDTAKQNCRALASSLVFQLATVSEKCQSYLRGKRSSHSPTYDELLGLLSGLLVLSGRTFIVIDALDECPKSARDSTGLLRFFEHLHGLQSQNDINLCVLVTSRPEIDIKKCISPLATHTLNINIAGEHVEDIKIYLSTRLFDLESESFSDWPEEIKWTVYNVLSNRSNGMFLWVVLQLHDLRDCAPNDVYRALYELPSDLDGTYERILKNFSSKPTMVTRARHLFECVAFSRAPLSPAQVAEIASIDFHSALPYVTSPSDDPATKVLRTCPRLLEVVSDDKGHKTVQFIHRSVQEYLTSETLRQAISPPAHPYNFDESSAHLTLAKICLSVLVSDGPLSSLQAYADGHWDDHVSSRDEDALGELLDSFLQMDSPSFVHWVGRTHHIINTSFHWAAFLGLYRSLKRMLECSPHALSAPADSLVRIRDGSGITALQYAACQGHVDVCRLLLEHGALVEDTDNHGNTPLHYAASNGQLDVVRLLLEYPVADESNAAALCLIRNNTGRTALHGAAYYGHAEVCRVMLEHGVLVDEKDDDSKTPLQLAKVSVYQEVVDVLLKYGATAVSDTSSLQSEREDDSALS